MKITEKFTRVRFLSVSGQAASVVGRQPTEREREPLCVGGRHSLNIHYKNSRFFQSNIECVNMAAADR